MRFLDLDLDFFLNKNAYYSACDSGRLGSGYKPWSVSKVRHFLEDRCGLSPDAPVQGRTVESHDRVLDFWRTLIESGRLRIPFEVIHIDAHPDLWVGGGLYLTSEFLHIDSERGLAMLKRKHVHSGNYLTFAIANGWVGSLVWIPLLKHLKDLPRWDGDARSVLIQMVGLYFLLKHFETSKMKYLFFTGLAYSLLIYASYSAIPYIFLSQLLCLYRREGSGIHSPIKSLLILNAFICLFCAPWLLFLFFNYRAQPVMDPLTIQDIGSLSSLLLAVFNDWAPSLPLTIVSACLLLLLVPLSKHRRNGIILLAMFIGPIGGLYAYCRLFHVTQFITSRYFINFLPLFLISLFLSVDAIEVRWTLVKRFLRPSLLFLFLLVASNVTLLPLYYRSEKQDFKGLATYLHSRLKDGDLILVKTFTYIPGILHYFRIYPKGRHYQIPFHWIDPGKVFEFRVALTSQNQRFTISHSNLPYNQYGADAKRIWIIAGKEAAEELQRNSSCVLQGYFDGSFSHFRRFPSDASMYLFLWDSNSPDENGIGMPID